MRLISVDNCSPGMRLAKPIYGGNGELLLGVGVELNDRYISKLKGIGIFSLYIEDPRLMDVEPEDIVNSEIRLEAISIVRDALLQATNEGTCRNVSRSLDQKIKRIVNDIVDDLIKSEKTIINVIDLRSYDGYTYAHSVNTCVLSIILGKALLYNDLRLRDLGVGLLLHDVGKMKIPASILNKPGKLTPDEFDVIRSHTNEGYQILQRDNEISALSRIVSLQHHERFDGTGYPKGLKGIDIYEFARIASIVDVFDALTSDRIYRRAYPPADVIKQVVVPENPQFDPDFVRAFVPHIALYPVGMTVKLNTGETAVVVSNDNADLSRPQVRILADPTGEPVSSPKDVNLEKETEYSIVGIIDY